MPRRVYISGRIKDYPEHEEHFIRAVRVIADMGHIPFSPLDNGLPASAHYSEHMREDLKMLLDCDAIFMLEGWERSAGARTEHAIACMCEMPIWYEVWVTPMVIARA